jgi:hypothetical protein
MMALALAGVNKVEGEKRRKRRALTDEQVAALLAVSGQRKIIYRTALSIGQPRDKRFVIAYPIGRDPDDPPVVKVIGPEFPGLDSRQRPLFFVALAKYCEITGLRGEGWGLIVF